MWEFRLYDVWAQRGKDGLYIAGNETSHVGDLLIAHTDLHAIPKDDVSQVHSHLIGEARKRPPEGATKTFNEQLTSVLYIERK